MFHFGTFSLGVRRAVQRTLLLPSAELRPPSFSAVRVASQCFHSSSFWSSSAPLSPSLSSTPCSLQAEETTSVSSSSPLTPHCSATAPPSPEGHRGSPLSYLPSRNATTIPLGPHRRVGNIFVILCVDHPFKHSWEVNRMLRELRLEFMGQVTIAPDIPMVRRQLWRVRHVVRVDMLDLDEAKALAGIPEHITFSDLNAQITPTFGRGRAYSSPVVRSKAEFFKLRRMRLRDVLHRDQLEKELLEEKRRALQLSEKQDNHKEDSAESVVTSRPAL